MAKEIKEYYYKCLTEMSSISEAQAIALRNGCDIYKIKNGRGIIGALAGIVGWSKGDYTFELLSYRKGKEKRTTNVNAVIKMDKKNPKTFGNLYKNKAMIYPRGTDPVYCGIRGETNNAVVKAYKQLNPKGQIGHLVYKTNQGTSTHYKESTTKAKQNESVQIKGEVFIKPEYYGSSIGKRHVVFYLKDKEGKLACVAYEPTKEFRQTISDLYEGDIVTVRGGIRKSQEEFPKSLGIEEITIHKLTPDLITPTCPKCNGSMRSMGLNKGHKCRKCKSKFSKLGKVKTKQTRKIKEERYVVPNCAIRHLTKPKRRDGREKAKFKTILKLGI